ncbi:MAG TPA: S1/P1 nuclease [Opitutaceae bacterium]
MTLRTRKFLPTLLLALAAASPAYPWGREGHAALATVASQNLSAEARAHVVKILGNDDLGSIASWMDDLRSATIHTGPLAFDAEAQRFIADFPKNGQWHYVDLPLGSKAYELDSPFSNPNDVVHMAEEAIRVLEGAGDKRIPRKVALYMLVHFVGDEHQPLHIGNGFYDIGADGSAKLVTDPDAAKGLPNDKGGNAIFFGPGRFDELHAYWDVALVTKITGSEDVAGLAAVLQNEITSKGAGWKSPGDYHHWPETWATESLVAARTAYAGLVFGAVTPDPKGGFAKIQITLPPRYDETCVPLAKQRLGQAAYHLAEVLNAIQWAD